MFNFLPIWIVMNSAKRRQEERERKQEEIERGNEKDGE